MLNKQCLLLAKTLSIVVSVVGVMVMAGWIFDIPVLKSILPGWVTMKFKTALCFFLSGITLFMMGLRLEGEEDFSELVLPVTTLIIFLTMVILMLSNLLRVSSGLESFFVKEAEGAVKTTLPGVPSMGTMASFILMAIIGLLTLMRSDKSLVNRLFLVGGAIFLFGTLAVVGYLLDIPVFYYTWHGWSTAMAFHTAILFMCLGAGVSLLGYGQSR